MIFVDSSVWIDYFNGIISWQTERLDQLFDEEIISIGDIVLAEVLQGFRSDKHYNQARTALTGLPCIPLCNKAIAVKSAENYRNLRKKGVTVRKTIDTIIGTFCIENEYTLLHCDKDFDVLAKHLGLTVLSQ